jgi:hypothetical protein
VKLSDFAPPDPPVEGWYRDPLGAHDERKWDGAKWTPYTRRAGQAPDAGRAAAANAAVEPFRGAKWEYHFENLVMSERWSAKRQAEESARFQNRLNSLGAQGWELVSYGPVGVHGSMSGKQRGTAYIGIFKRPLLD